MEDQAEQNLKTMDLECHRMLNFNAPLLSTRRAANSTVAGSSLGRLQITSVPFSWEQAPGKPKDQERSNSIHFGDGETPRLRLPPCLQHLPKAAADVLNSFDQDDGCDGDNDDNDESSSNNNNVDECSSYMINRFLPDATALAASSSAHFEKNGFSKKGGCDTWSDSRHSYAASSSSCSPKGCNSLQVLFPWRLKHKLCSIKSPVITCSTNVQNLKQSLRNKKHSSSLHKT
ncbi:hypothetical protein PIB30_065268, partial [Stylosanthes scabra]|nr:hypothetical protein [Stylosanthes scabra]